MSKRDLTDYFERCAVTPFWAPRGRPSDLKRRRAKSILGRTRERRQVQAHYFPGTSDKRALVVAGVHGSELSGIEAGRTLLASLARGPKPFYSTIVIPALFPDNAARARAQNPYPMLGVDSQIGRATDPEHAHRYRGRAVDPNRAFPLPGHAIDPAGPRDSRDVLIEPENIMFIDLIDKFQPSRIATLHAKHWHPRRRITERLRGVAMAGIFADPHTVEPGAGKRARREAKRKSSADARLALEMARRAARSGARVPGNWLPSSDPVSAYGIPSENFSGASLGRWAPREVCQGGSRDRPSIGVITIEIQHYHPSSAEPDAPARRRRRAELAAHAQAIREVFLEK